LREQEERRERDVRNEVAAHPLVQAVLETFPGATVTAVRERFAAEESEADEPSAELDPGDETNMGEDER
jgi:DNA polymerase-3 subunit gamma/tau